MDRPLIYGPGVGRTPRPTSGSARAAYEQALQHRAAATAAQPRPLPVRLWRAAARTVAATPAALGGVTRRGYRER
jgi:hypothetical protein